MHKTSCMQSFEQSLFGKYLVAYVLKAIDPYEIVYLYKQGAFGEKHTMQMQKMRTNSIKSQTFRQIIL